MSVKIYNGLKAVDTNPFRVAAQMRAVLEPVFYLKYKILLSRVEELVKIEPEATWADAFPIWTKRAGEKLADQRALDHSLYHLISHLHDEATFTGSPAAIGYEISLMENMSKDNEPLVLVFGEHSSQYIKILKDAGLVVDYGYWDNSDPDEDATEGEWEERAVAWKLLMDGAPAEVGLGFSHPTYVQTIMEKYKNK